MPTNRQRHMVTETPAVEEALDSVRERLNGGRLDLAELVVLGAAAKVQQLDGLEAENTARRRKLSEWILSGDIPVDIEASDHVRRHGWIHE